MSSALGSALLSATEPTDSGRNKHTQKVTPWPSGAGHSGEPSNDGIIYSWISGRPESLVSINAPASTTVERNTPELNHLYCNQCLTAESPLSCPSRLRGSRKRKCRGTS